MIGIPEFEDIDGMWDHVLRTVLSDGEEVDCRNGGSIEIRGFVSRLLLPANNLLMNRVRKLSRRYAAAELIWYLTGSDSGEMISHYAPSYTKFVEDDGRVWGAYGPRICSGLSKIVELLRNAPNTRQAVLPLFDCADLSVTETAIARAQDIPCTLNLHFLRRRGFLDLYVTMRSNDAWLGFPYDVFCFTMLQRIVANLTGTVPGIYQHQVGSMHLYRKDLPRAGKAADEDLLPSLAIAGAVPSSYDLYSNAVEKLWRAEEEHRKLGVVGWDIFPADHLFHNLLLLLTRSGESL